MTTIPERTETVGSIALALANQSPPTRDPIEQMREQLTEYESNISECITRSKQAFHGDFYVIVITKKERLLQNVIRNYFMSRLSCPTPDYDQIVYKYNTKNDDLNLLWVIPSRDTCYMFKEESVKIVPEEWGLLNYVLKFFDGTLFKLAQKSNNELFHTD